MEHCDALAGGTAQVICCEQGRVGTDVIFTPPMGLKGRLVAELNIESQHRSAVTAARAAKLLASNADEAVQAGKSGEDPTSTRVVADSKFRNNVFWVSCFWTCLGCVVCLKLFSPMKCKDQREGLPALQLRPQNRIHMRFRHGFPWPRTATLARPPVMVGAGLRSDLTRFAMQRP